MLVFASLSRWCRKRWTCYGEQWWLRILWISPLMMWYDRSLTTMKTWLGPKLLWRYSCLKYMIKYELIKLIAVKQSCGNSQDSNRIWLAESLPFIISPTIQLLTLNLLIQLQGVYQTENPGKHGKGIRIQSRFPIKIFYWISNKIQSRYSCSPKQQHSKRLPMSFSARVEGGWLGWRC